MNKELVILPDMYAKRSAGFVLALTVVLALLFWKSGVSGSNALAAFSFTGVVALCGLLSFETRISPGHQRVVRVWRLGGFIPVWSRAYPFTVFSGIQQLYFSEAQCDTWQVGLVTASGRFLMVTYFTSRHLSDPGPAAARFEEYLARILSLPVLDEAQEA